GDTVAWVHYDAEGEQHVKNVKIAELLVTEGLDRVPAKDGVVAGDIAAVTGIDEIMIGDTLCDVDHIEPLERIKIDDPA
ncbi:hypothetical protein QP341_26745, partial [Escherichia coli]|nr:hypothetical protein [Escherichia coli]